MTVTLSTQINIEDALAERLSRLRADHAEALAETIPQTGGDAADRATNVDAYARLAVIEQRIEAVEGELAGAPQATNRRAKDTVTAGAVVTLDLGDGPEKFLFASKELATGDIDVVTPSSPLGRAIDGVAAGSSVSYKAGDRRTREVTVVAVH